jgi:hypothetical protein
MTTATNTHFIVQTSSAKMPQNCWGTYRNVAVLEVEEGLEWVSMISDRARGCKRVVLRYGPQHVGSTDRCAYERTLKRAEEYAARLNAERR